MLIIQPNENAEQNDHPHDAGQSRALRCAPMANDSNQHVRSPFDVVRFVNHGAARGYSLNAFISARSRRALGEKADRQAAIPSYLNSVNMPVIM